MPDFQVTSPDGRKFKWTGEQPPGPADIQQFERQLPAATPPAATTPKTASTAGPAGARKPTGTATGGTLFESLPFLTGAAGAAVGGVSGAAIGGGAGAITVPGVGAIPGAASGAYFGSVAGAGAGGLIGRYAQHLLQQLMGGTTLGDFAGVPPLVKADASTHPLIGELGQAATQQMELEAGGQLLAAPLGWIARGGFLKRNRMVMQTLRENRAVGTKLSGPEIASGTPIGRFTKRVQQYGAGSMFGGGIQEPMREQGTAAAVGKINTAIDQLSTGSRSAINLGRAVRTGVEAAKTAQSEIGQQMEQVAKAANPVEMADIKQEALKEFYDLIVSPTATFPDLAGNARMANLVRNLRNDPTLIQRIPRPEMLRLADTLLEKTQSPRLRFLRNILGAEDQANFHGVWKQTQTLYAGSTEPDAIYAKNDLQRLSTRFAGLFRKALGAASPEFDQLSTLYGKGAKVLDSDALTTIYSTAVNNPEAVVDLFHNHPTRAIQLQRALLGVAGRGPQAAQASAAYDTIRSTYLQHEIIQGGKPVPTTEDGMDAMLQGIKDRLAAGRQSKVLTQWYSDTRGKSVMANLDKVANLLSKRAPATQGNLRMIFEMSRGIGALIAAGGAAASGRSIPASAFTTAIAWEAIPDLFVWMVHDPRAVKWFIEGTTATNPTVASAATVRLLELFRQTHQAAKQQAQRPGKPIPGMPPRAAQGP
jgi:hypothetical protein